MKFLFFPLNKKRSLCWFFVKAEGLKKNCPYFNKNVVLITGKEASITLYYVNFNGFKNWKNFGYFINVFKMKKFILNYFLLIVHLVGNSFRIFIDWIIGESPLLWLALYVEGKIERWLITKLFPRQTLIRLNEELFFFFLIIEGSITRRTVIAIRQTFFTR